MNFRQGSEIALLMPQSVLWGALGHSFIIILTMKFGLWAERFAPKRSTIVLTVADTMPFDKGPQPKQ